MKKASFLGLFLASFILFTPAAFAGGNNDHGRPHGGGDETPPVTVGNDNDIDVDVDVGGDHIIATGGNGEGGEASADANASVGDVSGGDAEANASVGDVSGGSAVIEDGAIRNTNDIVNTNTNDIVNTNTNENENVNNNDSSAESSSESSSDSSSTSSASVGDVNVYNVREAEKRIAGAIYVGTPDSPTSILYNATADAAEKGAAIRAEYVRVCRERYTRRHPIKTISWDRDKVRVQFTNHQNFIGKEKLDLDTPVDLIRPSKDGQVVNVDCLGLALVDSVEKKESLAAGKVETEFYDFVSDTLGQCTTHLYLYSMEETLAKNRGVDTKSGGLVGLLSQSAIIGSGTGGLGGSGSFGRSGAFGRVQLGNTYWVLCEDANGIPFYFGIPEETPPPEETPTEEAPEPPKMQDVATPPEEEVVRHKNPQERQVNLVKPPEARPSGE